MALSPTLKKMVSGAKNKYAGASGNTIKPKEGRNTYRILAPTPEQAKWVPASGIFWADLGVHWIKAEENGKPLAVVGDCDTVYQQPSAIATAIENAAANAIDEDSKKLYDSWKARKSVLVNVLDRGPNGSEDPQVLELTNTTWGKVLDLIEIYDAEGQDITDPDEGIDIIITRTGKALNTKYDVTVSPGKPKPVPHEVLGRCVDLHNFIAQNFFRGEEQKALNCIAQVAGVAVPQLGAPKSETATPTAALSSPAATVSDAQTVKEEQTTQPQAQQPEQEGEDPAVVAKREEILKRQREAEAELAALSNPAPKATEATSEDLSQLGQDDQESILAELDSLTG